jgi:hypothetical protein
MAYLILADKQLLSKPYLTGYSSILPIAIYFSLSHRPWYYTFNNLS